MSYRIAKLSYAGKPEFLEVVETLDQACHRAAKRSSTVHALVAVYDALETVRALAYAGKARWAIDCPACEGYMHSCMLCLGAGKIQDESWRGSL